LAKTIQQETQSDPDTNINITITNISSDVYLNIIEPWESNIWDSRAHGNEDRSKIDDKNITIKPKEIRMI